MTDINVSSEGKSFKVEGYNSMKSYILNVFKTSMPFKENPRTILKLTINWSSLYEFWCQVDNISISSIVDAVFNIKICQKLKLFKMIKGFFFKWSTPHKGEEILRTCKM